MKKSVIILLLLTGFICLFFQHQIEGANGMYLKTIGIVLTMFSVYKLSTQIDSKKEENDSGNFKF